MADILIRGLPPGVYRLIQQYAREENLSVNDYLIRLIENIWKRYKEREQSEARHAKAAQRLKKIRKKLHRKYGLSELNEGENG